MTWQDGLIKDCTVQPLTKFSDARGWLAEIFRRDELPDSLFPAMGYISLTYAGVTRGPHEHRDQSDLFVFFSGAFRLYLWDNRPASRDYRNRQLLDVGMANPVTVSVPPGVIHAYRNMGDSDAMVINCPNRLYSGYGRLEPVDEIRYEDMAYHDLILD